MKKLSLKEKIAYGMGDVGNGFLFDLGQTYLLKFFTDVLGIASAIGGSVFLVSKIFDAFADASVGTFIDSRSKIGKRGKFRPFILFGVIPLGIMSILCFTAPKLSPGAKIMYAYGTYMLFGLLYSIVNIPYGSLASAMTQDPQERTELGAFRNAGSTFALLFTGVIVMPIVLRFNNPKVGYPVAIGFVTILGIAAYLFCYKNTKENVIVVKDKHEKQSASKIMKSLFTNRPLIGLNLICLFTISANNVKTAVQIFYCQYTLKNVKFLVNLNFFTIACALLGIALVPKVVKKFGKKNTAIIGLVISMIGDIANYVSPTNITTFMIFSCITYFGTGFSNSIYFAFISDIIEYGEWKNGERTEGIIYSAYSFFRKMAQALSGFISGVVLSLVGYVPNAIQSEKTLHGLKGLLFLYPVVATGIAVIILIFVYNLTDEKYKQILVELKDRASKKALAVD